MQANAVHKTSAEIYSLQRAVSAVHPNKHMVCSWAVSRYPYPAAPAGSDLVQTENLSLDLLAKKICVTYPHAAMIEFYWCVGGSLCLKASDQVAIGVTV